MKGYCESCKKKVQGTKKPFSWSIFILGFGWVWGYWIYHWFKFKNKCPICGLKLTKKESWGDV